MRLKPALAFLAALAIFFLTAQASAGLYIPQLPLNTSPSGSDLLISWHSGTTTQSTADSFSSVFVDLANTQSITGAKTFSGTTTFGTGVFSTAIQGLSLSANAVVCTDGSSNLSTACTGLVPVTSVTAGDATVVIGGSSSAPTVKVTQAPSLTALTLSGALSVGSTLTMLGLATSAPVCTSSQHLATSSCNIAIVGTNKTAFEMITPQYTPTPLASGMFGTPVQVPINAQNVTTNGAFANCPGGSGSGLLTFQYYLATPANGSTPLLSTANPIGTAVSLPTGSSGAGGATWAPTTLPSAAAGYAAYVFPYIAGVPSTPPSGACIFTLQAMQTLQ